MSPELPQKMLETSQCHSYQFIVAYHTLGTLEKQFHVP